MDVRCPARPGNPSPTALAAGATLLILLLSGCATGPPAPPVLAGSPDQHGLVLADCSLQARRVKFFQESEVALSPIGCALGRVGDPAAVIRGRCWMGQLIFAGLEPGDYYLKLIEAEPVEETGIPLYRYVLPEGVVDSLRCSVQAGQMLYLGRISITEGHPPQSQSQPHTWTFNQAVGTDILEFSRGEADEKAAWQLFRQTFGGSQWGAGVADLTAR